MLNDGKLPEQSIMNNYKSKLRVFKFSDKLFKKIDTLNKNDLKPILTALKEKALEEKIPELDMVRNYFF